MCPSGHTNSERFLPVPGAGAQGPHIDTDEVGGWPTQASFGLFVVTTKIPALAKQQFSVASCQRRQPQMLRLGPRGDLAQEDKFMKEAGLALGTRNLKHKTRNWFPKLETGFQTLTGQRAILLRLSGSGGPTMVSDQPDKENRMKSQKLFVVARARNRYRRSSSARTCSVPNTTTAPSTTGCRWKGGTVTSPRC